MGKRLGRKRLFKLNEAGQNLTASNGLGATGCANFSQIREGRLIISEFSIDLAPAAGGEASPGTADLVIGLSSSVAVTSGITHHERSNMFQVDTAVHGLVTDAELICLETPAGSGASTDINLAIVAPGQLAANGGFSGSVGGKVIDGGVQDAPTSKAADLGGTDLHSNYLVLSRGTATNGLKGTYTAGKFIIRLFGWKVPDDA
jgi:hypothetical protein